MADHIAENKFFEIYTPEDLFDKAKREFEKLQECVNIDNIFNFFVTAYHIIDYVKAEGKTAIKKIDSVYENPEFKICQFICNKGKHLKLKKNSSHSTKVVKPMIWGQSMWGIDEWGLGNYYLISGDQRYSVTEIAKKIISFWEEFLKTRSI